MSKRPWRVESMRQEDGEWYPHNHFGAFGSSDSAGSAVEKWKQHIFRETGNLFAARQPYRVVNRDTAEVIPL